MVRLTSLINAHVENFKQYNNKKNWFNDDDDDDGDVIFQAEDEFCYRPKSI